MKNIWRLKTMWDREYPTHIEVPEDYWVCSHNVEYVESN